MEGFSYVAPSPGIDCHKQQRKAWAGHATGNLTVEDFLSTGHHLAEKGDIEGVACCGWTAVLF